MTNTPPARPDFEADALRETLLAALEADDSIVVLASHLATNVLPSPGNRLAGLVREVAERYPARFYGVGEFLQELVPTAARLLSEDKIPLALMSSADLARSYAGLSAVCAAHLPMTFVLVAGQEEGQTWRPEGVNDLAVLLTLPQLAIADPADKLELAQQLGAALAYSDGPVVVRYLPFAAATASLTALSGTPYIGKGAMLRQGKELAVIALGQAVETARQVCDRLHEDGHEAALVSARWARPLDEPLLAAVANRFPRIVTIEYGGLTGGFGAELLSFLERTGWQHVWLRRFGLSETNPIEAAKIAQEIGRFLERANHEDGFGILPRPSESF